MSRATLLHREATTKSLKTLVECAHRQRVPSRDYDLAIRGGQLVLTALALKNVPPLQKQTSTDEGFESDVDSISLISADEAFTSTTKGQETDSANGSACSDSDDVDSPTSVVKIEEIQSIEIKSQETFNLVNCICYTDIKFPDTLVFVILNEALVFKFDNLDELHLFYSNFSNVKAVANQRAYGATKISKFNLLQRTDSNGVTHIEISRPEQFRGYLEDDNEPSSIISINTPDSFLKSYVKPKKSLSTENLLDEPIEGVKKFWSSVENLADPPKKPDRRRRQKGPAPQPPVNVLKGQFVRVNVQKNDQMLKSPPAPQQEPKFAFLRYRFPNTFQQFKFSDPKRLIEVKQPSPWTNSIPRLLKKSKSDNKLFMPMAYRYIDTTTSSSPLQPPPTAYTPRYKSNRVNPAQTISNRLFGMSSKLKEFGSVQSSCNVNSKYQTKDPRYGSLGNLSYPDATLKSVIKKDDVKKKNDKKVTFSAYNTVQVV